MLVPLLLLALTGLRIGSVWSDADAAARMLIAEAGDVQGDETGEWATILTIAQNRATAYHLPLELVVSGRNPPGPCSAWNSSSEYAADYASAPTAARFQAAFRLALVRLALDVRDPAVGRRIGFVHGSRRPAWLTDPITIGRVTAGGYA